MTDGGSLDTGDVVARNYANGRVDAYICIGYTRGKKSRWFRCSSGTIIDTWWHEFKPDEWMPKNYAYVGIVPPAGLRTIIEEEIELRR